MVSVPSVILSVVAVGFLLLLVSTEAKAAITAIEWGMRYKREGGNQVARVPQPLRKVLQLVRLRYVFGSFLFHQVFARKRLAEPAYRLGEPLLLLVLTYGALALAGERVDVEVMPRLGASLLTSFGYFGAQYRGAFLAHRAFIAEVTAKGDVLAFD